MAETLSMSPPPVLRTRIRDSPSPRTRTKISTSSSVSPPPTHVPPRTTSSPRLSTSQAHLRRRQSRGSSATPGKANASASSSGTKENIPVDMDGYADGTSSRILRSGKTSKMTESNIDLGNGGGKTWRDGSIEPEEDGIKARKPTSARSVRSSKSPGPSSRPTSASPSTTSSPYNGLPTLPTIPDPENDEELSPIESVSSKTTVPPPPAMSTQASSGRIVTRKRRSSSVKRKPSPGVKPTKVVDWEIPRKTLHSSIGVLTLILNHLDPKDLKPLITLLSTGLVSVYVTDLARLNYPAFAELWESYVGFLMREQERNRINGVVWYLIGVIFVLAVYPRDVAVIAILTLSWSDTTASTIGRLWGRHTPPLPSHFPGISKLRFAPRKSLAGFLAATVTGIFICIGFWWRGSNGRWAILDGHWAGLLSTSFVVGVGGAIAEALDLGFDDNLTLPIISGAVVWIWLTITNHLL